MLGAGGGRRRRYTWKSADWGFVCDSILRIGGLKAMESIASRKVGVDLISYGDGLSTLGVEIGMVDTATNIETESDHHQISFFEYFTIILHIGNWNTKQR